MSEYQYYEFQAIDRPLSEADIDALGNLSSRARITATSFTNSYQWGDFRGDPAKLMERWFDLHLYMANWGSRRLMIRLPARLVDPALLDTFIGEADCASVTVAGENLIVDLGVDEVETDDEDDGSGRLAALAPLRADILGGDLRLFYLVWLISVQHDEVDADTLEPMPGIGPMTGALEAFADFFDIDSALVEAAAERSADPISGVPGASEAARRIIEAIPDEDKTNLLLRLVEGDVHAASELRGLVRRRLTLENEGSPPAARSVAELRARAEAIHGERERAHAAKVAAERKRQEEEAERKRRAHFDEIAQRGNRIWPEIETAIERRNATGYEKAASLLFDLWTIAQEKGDTEDFAHRLRAIRERHAAKGRFIERLATLP